MYQDLHKSRYETFTTEIGVLYNSIGLLIKNIKKWAKPQRVPTPLIFFGAKSYIYHEPYGTVLIIGPFNYPVNLVFEPLIGAIAAGNCAVIKPAQMTPNVSKIIAKIIKESFARRLHPGYRRRPSKLRLHSSMRRLIISFLPAA